MVAPAIFSPGGAHLNALLLEWCSSRIGGNFQIGSVAIGVAEGDSILAVAAFDNYRKSPAGKPLSIECSFAADSPRWITRGTIRGILSYPFCQLGVQRVTTFIREDNERSIKFTYGLGFVQEGYMRDCAEDGLGVHITGMLRAEARRWLGDI